MAADLKSLRLLAHNGRVQWSVHASARIVERGICRADVINVLESNINEVLETQAPEKSWQDERYAVYCVHKPDIIVVVTVITGADSLPMLLIITVEHPKTDKWAYNISPPPSLVRIG